MKLLRISQRMASGRIVKVDASLCHTGINYLLSYLLEVLQLIQGIIEMWHPVEAVVKRRRRGNHRVWQ